MSIRAQSSKLPAEHHKPTTLHHRRNVQKRVSIPRAPKKTIADIHNSLTPGSKSKVKSSVQRALRAQLCTTYPLLTPYIDEIIPKKEQLDAMKMYVHQSSSFYAQLKILMPRQRPSNPLPNILNAHILPTHDRPTPPSLKTRP